MPVQVPFSLGLSSPGDFASRKCTSSTTLKLGVKNQKGQSLVQVLVAAAIMSVVMLATVSTITMQQRENKALTEKLASLDAFRSVTQHLSNSTTCNAILDVANLVNPSDMPFDATSVSTATPYVFSLKQLPSGGSGPPSAAAGELISPLSTSLYLLADNATPAPGIQISVSSLSPPSATLSLNFDQGKLVHPLRNLTFPLNIMVSGPVNSTTVTGCGTPSGNGMIAYVVDQKPSGINAGNAVPGTWATRDLNTVIFDTGVGVTVAANRMTLPAGAYAVSITAPVECTLMYKVRLQNITDGTTTALGTAVTSSDNYNYTAQSIIYTYFSINSPKTFEVQHWGTTNYHAGYCVGHAVGDGTPEIYTTIRITKQ